MVPATRQGKVFSLEHSVALEDAFGSHACSLDCLPCV